MSGVGYLLEALLFHYLMFIYLLLKAAYSDNINEAKDFFNQSGEKSEKYRGAPEVIILFTSREVISGECKIKPVRSKWFNIGVIKSADFKSVFLKFVSKLLNELRTQSLRDVVRKLKRVYLKLT
ncbi:MAG: hypothetical protein J7L07_06795 [Candidatus Odinarchaeota archaeon]|nr:hypothetical protein [Candidatus Odinarchaeota archaeon]